MTIDMKEKKSSALSRRRFLKTTGVACGTAAVAGLTACESGVAEKKTSLQWGMIIDLQKCVGCKACVVACKAENHTPPGVAYNVVLEEEVGKYPDVRKHFLSRPCFHCEKPSCTMVCPTKATYKRKEDGLVVVDYDRCIGCRYCIAACPYGARAFDYGYDYNETATDYDRQPSPEYGQYRKRKKKISPIGNVRKCTFCLHRIKKGLNPACAETCIGRAIHFGNLHDPDGKCLVHGEKLQEMLVTRGHMRLKEELGNNPSVYYLT